jgi:hypothetical protein
MSQTNRPTAPSPATIQEWLADSEAALVKRRDEILAGYKRFLAANPTGIQDEGVQARAADFAGPKGLMNAFLREAEQDRNVEKRPYLDGGDAVDAFFATLKDPVESCQKDMRTKMRVFAERLEEERRKAARLEAERLAAEAALAEDHAVDTMDEQDLQTAMEIAREAEAAQALAEAKPAELSRTRGEMGTVVSLRSRWVADYEASDLMGLVRAVARGEAPLHYLQFNTTRINYAVRTEKVRVIPGVRIKEDRSI